METTLSKFGKVTSLYHTYIKRRTGRGTNIKKTEKTTHLLCLQKHASKRDIKNYKVKMDRQKL